MHPDNLDVLRGSGDHVNGPTQSVAKMVPCTTSRNEVLMTAEAWFERELEQLRRNSEAAIQFLYAWLSFHACAGDSQEIRRAINRTPLFWNTSLGALQTSLFIALGRIFDLDPKSHSLEAILLIVEKNPGIFSRPSLARRKAQQSPGAPWIDEYVQNAYVPDVSDFRRIRRFAQSRRSVYDKAYKKIRNKVFAHSGIATRLQSDELFGSTKIGELQRLVLSLRNLQETLYQLYMNGRKPQAMKVRYGVTALRRAASRNDHYSLPVQERIVVEAFKLLRSLSTA
ncbi:MAG: hypothetical protein ACKVOI_11605 [Dongiaceae bacterium]